jgi:pimeloyl-ACP methyl ester carboxylesterase/uncharacterized protein YjiS (DUF1127 family)
MEAGLQHCLERQDGAAPATIARRVPRKPVSTIADVRGCIEYDESGYGPTIVLVPGSCSTGAAWQPLVAQWEGGFRCVTTSLLGYGGTAERRAAFDADIAPADIAHEAEIVEAVIRRAGGKVHLVGQSFGGLVALAVALRRKVALLSLTIIEAPAAALLRESGEHRHYHAFRAMTCAYFAAFHAGDRAAIGSMIDFYGGAGTFAIWPRRVRDYAIETTAVNMLDWASAYGFAPPPESLARIAVPTLILTGAASHPAMRRASEILAQSIAKTSLVTVAGAAHFMIATHAEELAWAIAGHVARAEAAIGAADARPAALTPMHNRFAPGFVGSEASNGTLDPLSSRISPVPLAAAGPNRDPNHDEVLRRARGARSAALGAMLARAGRCLVAVLAAVFWAPPRALIDRLLAWRRHHRIAMELYAVDERTLADLGLRRSDIPFIAAQSALDRQIRPRTVVVSRFEV